MSRGPPRRHWALLPLSGESRREGGCTILFYICNSSAMHSGSSYRGWLEVTCEERARWETHLRTFRNSHWLSTTVTSPIASFSVWCLGALMCVPLLHILYRNMLQKYRMIQKYGLATENHVSFSLILILPLHLAKSEQYLPSGIFTLPFLVVQWGAPSTISVSIPGLFQQIKYRSKVAVTQLNRSSEHLQKSDCYTVE